ncbi:hypothetical protein BUALT_Bualt11G0098100 [Buddleja alternifolia]|uniref:Uncharacterized protein n=1 Tax=Buddleja alternifolia TaxID=168488 RepID=A0AAV6X0Z7_9LAMI|nr:hypothetical protein BUALT_Bualt11G0098100 [Buddleja alternifolia]
MPQVDLETLVTACSGGGTDRKIACETLADPPENDAIAAPDLPPESFWLSKDAEYDWFDRNAFYERKESAKFGNANSNPLVNPSSNSQRLSISLKSKSKASMIGLPKTQKAAFVESKRRTCKPANIRLFPKRTASAAAAGKSAVPVAEPGSPKVSCMGRVRSKRCRRRSNSVKRDEKPVDKHRTGFYSKLMSIFRSKKGGGKPVRSGSRKVEVVEEEVVVAEPERRSVSITPGLGGMNRFASGRRSGSWTGDDFN